MNILNKLKKFAANHVADTTGYPYGKWYLTKSVFECVGIFLLGWVVAPLYALFRLMMLLIVAPQHLRSRGSWMEWRHLTDEKEPTDDETDDTEELDDKKVKEQFKSLL